MTRRESTIVRVLVLLGLFALALWVRLLTWHEVLGAEHIYFHGNDAYYHMRRIAWSVANFPAVLAFDPYINFPDGAAPIWTPVFDWLIACGAWFGARESVLSGDLQSLERFAAWFPPFLGAITVVVLYEVARRALGRWEALAAGFVLCFLPGHAWYSQIGFVDHHVAVALVATILLGCGIWLLRAPGPLSTVATGAAAALALTTWPGMLLHLAPLEIALLVDCACRRSSGEAAAHARHFAALNALACAMISPFSLSSDFPQWGRFSPVVLSAFQPWIFAVLALLGLACSFLFRLTFTDGRWRRLSTAALLSVALLCASLLVIPDLSSGVADVWEWLSRSDSFQAQVKESQPLIAIAAGRHAFDFAAGSLSLFFLAVPVALVAFARWSWRQVNPAPLLYAMAFAITMCCAALLQSRFVNSASLAVALIFGWSTVRMHTRLTRAGGSGRRRAMAALVGLAALGLLAPVFPNYLPYVSSLPWIASRKPVPLDPPELRRRITLETGDWLRRNTPQPGEWLSVSPRPRYGVLAPWYLGHPLGYASRRPTVSNNFGNDIGERNFDLARRYFDLDEANAVPLLESLRVRYVVVDWPPGGAGDPHTPSFMAAALYLRNGNAFVDDAGRELVPALRRHRLIYESRPLNRMNPKSPPYLKVFEMVTGALVTGRASPGATVTATLGIQSNRRRAFEYRNRSVVGSDGRYRIVVPYSNVGHSSGIQPNASYVMECGGDSVSLTIRESDVTNGTEIEGPDLCRSGADR